MSQNSKVVHWPGSGPFETSLATAADSRGNHERGVLWLDYKPSFCHFELYPVRFEPIAVLVVHTETNKLAHLYMNGPMDTNSVKNGAMVTDMRQKLNYTDFWHVSRLARPRQLLDSLCVTGKDKSIVKSQNA